MITFVIVIFSPFSLWERIRFHKKVVNTEITQPPIFVLGHWRSGTTHMQNLLLEDERFAYPNMIDTLFPNHNLGSKFFLRRFLALILPDKRPMDNMLLSVDVAGEHDWTLSNLTLLSPYTSTYFPNNMKKYFKYASFDEATDDEKERFKKSFVYFLKKLTFKYDGRQLVLKSPMDTARVRFLLEMFPNAKFVHIYRNPYHVFFSTKKLHTKNQGIYPLQTDHRDLDEFIFDTYSNIFDVFHRDVKLIPENNYVEISYEDLVKETIPELERIYTKLNLPDFEVARPDIEAYVNSLKSYKVDKYGISEEDKRRIFKKWKYNILKWGYERPKSKKAKKSKKTPTPATTTTTTTTS